MTMSIAGHRVKKHLRGFATSLHLASAFTKPELLEQCRISFLYILIALF